MAKTKEAPANALVPTDEAPLATVDLDAEAMLDAADRQEVDREDLATPFLRLLQDNSPEVKERGTGFVPGTKPGLFFHTITKESFERLVVLPLFYRKSLVEWRPRPPKGAGGFVADHPFSDEKAREATRVEDPETRKLRDVLPNGNELVLTMTYYLLAYDPISGWFEAVLPLTSTQLKYARAWNTAHKAVPPIRGSDGREVVPQPYYYTWDLGTQIESKNNFTWFSVQIARGAKVGERFDASVYLRARDIASALRSGMKKVDLSKMGTEPGDAAEDGEPLPY